MRIGGERTGVVANTKYETDWGYVYDMRRTCGGKILMVQVAISQMEHDLYRAIAARKLWRWREELRQAVVRTTHQHITV